MVRWSLVFEDVLDVRWRYDSKLGHHKNSDLNLSIFTYPLIPSLDAFCTPDASVFVTSLVTILVWPSNSSSMASVAARRMKGQMKEGTGSVGEEISRPLFRLDYFCTL